MQHITNIIITGRRIKGACTCGMVQLGTKREGVAAVLSDHLNREGVQLSEGRCVA